MAYAHSFAAEFYHGDPSAPEHDSRGRPLSVATALRGMSDRDWKAMCEDCFPGADPEYVDLDDVIRLICETDTVSNLTTPVEVWIDREGFHTIRVW